jgi:hypothetical protein
MSDTINERFFSLIKAISIKEIRPVDFHSQILDDQPPQGDQIKLEWKQSFAEGDPVTPSPDIKVFRPRYVFSVISEEKEYFRQISVFILVFNVLEPETFASLWADEELRKMFLERQVQRTLWPIFRQQVLDGMSRVGLKPLPLPWIY